jgi:hypothetical protein
MTQIDVEKLAREAGMICSHNIENKIVSCDARRHSLMSFAALVLEHAAQTFDPDPNAEMFRDGVAEELREMAKELKP